MSAKLHPEIVYAERSSATDAEKVSLASVYHISDFPFDFYWSSYQNVIYFTINAPDIVGEPTLDIKATEISFSAKAGE